MEVPYRHGAVLQGLWKRNVLNVGGRRAETGIIGCQLTASSRGAMPEERVPEEQVPEDGVPGDGVPREQVPEEQRSNWKCASTDGCEIYKNKIA